MRRVALGFAVVVALADLPAIARAVDLEGYWYVLVHYQDKDTNKPEAWRWEDRVWRFHKTGDRLEWTDWPIVSLRDETGRFETLSRQPRGARRSRPGSRTPRSSPTSSDGLAAQLARLEDQDAARASGGGSGWELRRAARAAIRRW